MWAHSEEAVPAASETVLEHLKQGDCTTAITCILVVVIDCGKHYLCMDENDVMPPVIAVSSSLRCNKHSLC